MSLDAVVKNFEFSLMLIDSIFSLCWLYILYLLLLRCCITYSVAHKPFFLFSYDLTYLNDLLFEPVYLKVSKLSGAFILHGRLSYFVEYFYTLLSFSDAQVNDAL